MNGTSTPDSEGVDSTTGNMTATVNYTFCGPELVEFHHGYIKMHGYLSLLVCVFGSIANTLNIAVLTRREMRSPTNLILTGLAVADLLVMLEYIPYTCHMYIYPDSRPKEDRFSYGWSMFVLVHAVFTQICHTISIWLTVTLAIWRYIAIAHPQRNPEWCNMDTTITAIVAAYLICPIVCAPIIFTFSLNSKNVEFFQNGSIVNTSTYNSSLHGPTHNGTIYFVAISELGKQNDNLLHKINLWVYSTLIKLIPCVALSCLSTRLIMALVEAKKRRQNLTGVAVPLTTTCSTENGEVLQSVHKKPKNARLADKERQTDRTTRMLLAVLLLFLITEFPQGILGLLSIMLGEKFFLECYYNIGEVMDILALLNSAINFILYCAMSRQFRTTFNSMFGPKVFDRWLPVPNHDQLDGNGNGHTTGVTQVTQV